MTFFFRFLALAAVILLRGEALWLLWDWFIVTTFALPALSLLNAVGFCIIASLLMAQHIPRQDDDQWLDLLKFQILTPVVLTGMGWIVHRLM